MIIAVGVAQVTLFETEAGITALEPKVRSATDSRALHALKFVFDRKTQQGSSSLYPYGSLLYPELVLEDDINQLLATHEAIVECVLGAIAGEHTFSSPLEDLTSLRDLNEGHLRFEENFEVRDLGA